MKITVIGGAGFIGSNLISRLLRSGSDQITAFDNFSSGKLWHLEPLLINKRLKLIRADIIEQDPLTEAMAGTDVLYHLASNPDISRAVTEPAIDFERGTLLTHLVFEAARKAKVKSIVYASGSGVFGDDADREFDEDSFSPRPTSTYAASKIAGEALLSAYCSMFGINGVTYRFANVVGSNQTHGVGFDFIRKLRLNPAILNVLGNGLQSKSYIHVDDVVDGLLLFLAKGFTGYDYFNLCTGDYITVKDIAASVIGEMGLTNVAVQYGVSPKGWSGDVPIIRFSSAKARKAGWKNRYSSSEAMRLSIRGMLSNLAQQKLDG